MTKNNNENKFYDLAIIGSGPAGINAAFQASKLGKSVCIIEKTPAMLGGAWLQTGTLPSKTVRESLSAILNIKHHVDDKWVERIINHLSTKRLFKTAKKVTEQEESLVRSYLEKNGIDVIVGSGFIEKTDTIAIHHEGTVSRISTTKVLIATGSRPRRPKDIPFDGWRVIDSDELLNLECVPKDMIICGAGVVGCEYACIFGALGTKVTLVDARPNIMPNLDTEISRELETFMTDLGVKMVLSASIDEITSSDASALVKIGNKTYETGILLFAAGRLSNTNNLGLEALGVSLSNRGAILVDKNFQTNIEGVYSAGDAIGYPALAATAAHQGRIACMHAFDIPHEEFPDQFPVGIFTIPEMSSIGPSEDDLKKSNTEHVVGRAYFSEVARGFIGGHSHGLLKLIVDPKTCCILGVHIVGEDACNLIHIGQGLMLGKTCLQDVLNKMIFNYPTLAELYRIAAFNALNKIYPQGNFEPNG